MSAIDVDELLAAAQRLKSGGLVAVPTETVYGLAAQASSDEALRKLFKIKGRPFFDPLIVHVSGVAQASALSSDWTFTADFLARWFWPGPLTIVVKKAPSVSDLIVSGLPNVAIRWADHPLLDDLLRLLGEPVAAPSANKFGKTSPSTAAHVRSEFPEDDLMILDGGPCKIGVESTVISALQEGFIEILRPGAISKQDLEKACERVSRKIEVRHAQASDADAPLAPGRLKAHYQPAAPLALASPEATREQILLRAKESLQTAPKNVSELILPNDAALAARILYAEMRRLCDAGADFLWTRADLNSNVGLWSAIRDRLERAAAYDWRQKP